MLRVILGVLSICFATSVALADVVNVGAAFGSFQPYIDSIVGLAITSLVGWVLYIVQSKLKVSIDSDMRDALQTWLQRQASSLVADGLVKVSGLQVNVSNASLASVANLALQEIPDALAHFGLTPDALAAMIKDKIPQVPAVAAVAAATPAAAPAA